MLNDDDIEDVIMARGGDRQQRVPLPRPRPNFPPQLPLRGGMMPNERDAARNQYDALLYFHGPNSLPEDQIVDMLMMSQTPAEQWDTYLQSNRMGSPPNPPQNFMHRGRAYPEQEATPRRSFPEYFGGQNPPQPPFVQPEARQQFDVDEFTNMMRELDRGRRADEEYGVNE